MKSVVPFLSGGMKRQKKVPAVVGGWLKGGYQRVKLVIPAGCVSGTLTDFPVYLDMSLLPQEVWQAYKGLDLWLITASDGKTLLDSELVSVDYTNKKGEYYFRADLTDEADNIFYLYPRVLGWVSIGDSNYTNPNVWKDYLVVYHFNTIQDPLYRAGTCNVYWRYSDPEFPESGEWVAQRVSGDYFSSDMEGTQIIIGGNTYWIWWVESDSIIVLDSGQEMSNASWSWVRDRELILDSTRRADIELTSGEIGDYGIGKGWYSPNMDSSITSENEIGDHDGSDFLLTMYIKRGYSTSAGKMIFDLTNQAGTWLRGQNWEHGWTHPYQAGTSLYDTDWHILHILASGDYVSMYIDGDLKRTDSYNRKFLKERVSMGAGWDANVETWTSETRLLKRTVTSDWVETEARNLLNPSEFIQVVSVERRSI